MGKSIERYLGQVEALLPSGLDEAVRRCLVDEAENHLYESAAGYRELGHSEVEAEDLAVEAYGRSREVVGEMALPVSQSFDSKVVHWSFAVAVVLVVLGVYVDRFSPPIIARPQIITMLPNLSPILFGATIVGFVVLIRSAWRVDEFRISRWLRNGWAVTGSVGLLVVVVGLLDGHFQRIPNLLNLPNTVRIFGEAYSTDIVQMLCDQLNYTVRMLSFAAAFEMIKTLGVIYMVRGVRVLWNREMRARTRARQKA